MALARSLAVTGPLTPSAPRERDGPPSQFALFEAAIGIGATTTGLALPRVRGHLSGMRAKTKALAAGAVSYGLAAALFAGTTWIPAAYLGAFAWGASGMVFYTRWPARSWPSPESALARSPWRRSLSQPGQRASEGNARGAQNQCAGSSVWT